MQTIVALVLIGTVFAAGLEKQSAHSQHYNPEGPRYCKHRYNIEDMEACPGSDPTYPTCVREVDMCNGLVDCPNGADEDADYCFLHTLNRMALKPIKLAMQDLYEKMPKEYKARHGHADDHRPTDKIESVDAQGLVWTDITEDDEKYD
ncbi:unnamed protein product, partial [Mesorhabditis spiculigera]